MRLGGRTPQKRLSPSGDTDPSLDIISWHPGQHKITYADQSSHFCARMSTVWRGVLDLLPEGSGHFSLVYTPAWLLLSIIRLDTSPLDRAVSSQHKSCPGTHGCAQWYLWESGSRVVSLNAFLLQTTGKLVTAPGGLGGQCVDLVNLYLLRCYGLPHVFRNAKDWAGIALPGFRWEPNGPTNAPTCGAIVVWHPTVGGLIGASGHVDIAIEGDSTLFLGFDQNWGTPPTCQYVEHTYEGVAGWHIPPTR